MSWLARARVKAFVFFAVCAGGMGYLAVHSFDHAKPAVGVVSAVGAALAVYVLGSGLVAWRRGELPGFDSPDEVRRYIRRRNRPN
jgi:hypothetical protein